MHLRRPSDIRALRRARAANINLPRADIELAEHALDLPSAGAVVQVRGREHVDALHRPLLHADGRHPAKCYLVAGEHHLAHGEADCGLCALAGDEGPQRGEGVPAEGDAREPVDGVGGVGEVTGKEAVGRGVGVGGEEGAVAVGEIGGGGVGEAQGGGGGG